MNFILLTISFLSYDLKAHDTIKRLDSLENFIDEKYPLTDRDEKILIKDMRFEKHEDYDLFMKHLIASATNCNYEIPDNICEDVIARTEEDSTLKPLQDNFLMYIKNKKEVSTNLLRNIIKKDSKVKNFILRNLRDMEIKEPSHGLSSLEKILFYFSIIQEKDDFVYLKFIWDDEAVFFKDINKEGVLCNLTNAIFRVVQKEDMFYFSTDYPELINYIKTGDKFYFLNYFLENEKLDLALYFFDKMEIQKNKNISILNDYFMRGIENIVLNNSEDIKFMKIEFFLDKPLFHKKTRLEGLIDLFHQSQYVTDEAYLMFREKIFEQDVKLFERVLSNYKNAKDISIIIKKFLPHIDIQTKEQKKIISKMILSALTASTKQSVKAYEDVKNHMIGEY